MPPLIGPLLKVKSVKRADGWWVINLPWPDCTEYGPYDTKAEAEESRQRAFDFYRNHDKKGFITVDKRMQATETSPQVLKAFEVYKEAREKVEERLEELDTQHEAPDLDDIGVKLD